MKLIFDVLSGHAKYRSSEEPQPSPHRTTAPKDRQISEIPGYRKDGTDRGAMIVAFSRHFPGLSVRALGRLFDKYRITGRIDVRWNAETGQYDILFGSNPRWVDAIPGVE
jgi:hypothetical protein